MSNKPCDAAKWLQLTGHVLTEPKGKYSTWEIGMKVRPEEVIHTAKLWWNGFDHLGTGSSALITEIATFCWLKPQAAGTGTWQP